MSMWTILPCLAELGDLAGHAVVEPHAEGEQQIGLVDRVVGVDAAVHAEHVERQRIVAGKAPRPISVMVTGMPVLRDQLAQLVAGVGR